MKRKTLKTMLGCLTLALTCSICVGVGTAVSAYAAEVDANTLDTAFSSLTLVDGASVRYNTDGKGNGISYALSMTKTEYDAVMANEAYTNVKFGILIAPNDYYVVHPFNNQANIDTYYSLNAEATGKAFLYDLNSSQMTEWNNDTSNVYFRGSIVNILDKNITLDFRGVGYVEYTKGETTEKHFFTNDETHVRSMAYVAEQAVKAGKDTDRTLQTTYLDKVADPFATAINGGTANVYNNATAKLDLTVKELSKVQNNTYFKDKYTYAWTLTGADGTVSVENGASLNGRVGTYTLACTATKTSTSETKEVYSQTLNITDLGTTTVNGKKLTGVKGMLVKTADGTYKNEYDKNEDVVMYYTDKVQNGNFKLNAEITTISGADNSVGGGGDRGAEVGIVLACGNGLEISVFSKKAYLDSNQLYLRVGTNGQTQIAVSGFSVSNVSAGSTFAATGAKLIFSVERKDNTLIFYNQAGTEIFKVNSDGTITATGGTVSWTDANKSAVKDRLAAMLAKGNETAFGIYRKAHNKGAYDWNVSLAQ